MHLPKREFRDSAHAASRLGVIASAAKQSMAATKRKDGLLRFARNDGLCSLKIVSDVIRDERQGYRLRTGR
jgi:hypothetical protein